jgi:hypothetical protein
LEHNSVSFVFSGVFLRFLLPLFVFTV